MLSQRIALALIVYRKAIGQAAKLSHPNRSKFRCKNTLNEVTLRIYTASNYSLEVKRGVCRFLSLPGKTLEKRMELDYTSDKNEYLLKEEEKINC